MHFNFLPAKIAMFRFNHGYLLEADPKACFSFVDELCQEVIYPRGKVCGVIVWIVRVAVSQDRCSCRETYLDIEGSGTDFDILTSLEMTAAFQYLGKNTGKSDPAIWLMYSLKDILIFVLPLEWASFHHCRSFRWDPINVF